MQLRIYYEILCVYYIYVYVYVRILSYIIRLDDLAKAIMKFHGRNLNPNIMWVSKQQEGKHLVILQREHVDSIHTNWSGPQIQFCQQQIR